MKPGPTNCSSLLSLPRRPAVVPTLGQRCNCWRAFTHNCQRRSSTSLSERLIGGLRVYDLRDAEERAETLREWAAQEPDAGEYELPDVAGSVPPCMRQAVLENSELAHVKDRINDSTARKLVDAVIALDGVSRGAERPELDDDIGEQLSDCNPPLPCLLAVFADGDAIAGWFDEEAQGMMEVEPEPNIIIPFDPTDTESVQRTFHMFGVACQTIAAASRVD